MWRDIEVVITALTRNQVYSNVPRVRIPLSPPILNGHPEWGGPFNIADNDTILNPLKIALRF